jgi:hypothetical protein
MNPYFISGVIGAVQEKLWKIFELEKIEKQLSLHK